MITALPGALVRTKFLLAAALFAWALPAEASPLNPWGAHVGRKTFALTPFVYVYPTTPEIYPLIYGQYGFTDNFELLFGVGGGIYPGTTPVGAFETIELMPRQFFNETSAIALHLTLATDTGQLDAAPEFHGAYELGPITLTVNAGGGIGLALGSSVGVTGGLYGIVAPEWYFTEASSVFLEINPSYDFSSLGSNPNAFALELVPGISTSIAETHYFAFGVGIPITGFDPTDIYGGVWYSIAFGGDEG